MHRKHSQAQQNSLGSEATSVQILRKGLQPEVKHGEACRHLLQPELPSQEQNLQVQDHEGVQEDFVAFLIPYLKINLAKARESEKC